MFHFIYFIDNPVKTLINQTFTRPLGISIDVHNREVTDFFLEKPCTNRCYTFFFFSLEIIFHHQSFLKLLHNPRNALQYIFFFTFFTTPWKLYTLTLLSGLVTRSSWRSCGFVQVRMSPRLLAVKHENVITIIKLCVKLAELSAERPDP